MSKSQGTGIVLLVVPQHLGANNAVKPTAYGGGLLLTLVPSPVSCAHPPVPALRPVPKAFKPFGPPALASQAPPAILLAALRRFGGPAPLRGLRPSSRLGAPFWPSGLTLRSSGLAFSQPLTLAVSQFFFNDPLIMKNILFVASAALFLSACASPARYAWVKEGASDHQRTNDTSECTYQVRLNKTPVAEQKELHSLCMQGKGYRMKRIG